MTKLRLRLAAAPSSLWLCVFMMLAGGGRLYHLGEHSLWFDEAIATLSVQYPVSQIVAQRIDPMAPPMYYVLLHFWLRLGGWPGVAASETLLRSFSVLWSVAALPVVYLLGRRLFDRRVGLLAAFLMMIAPFQIAYAQEARSYSLVILCGALLLLLFVRALATDRVRDWIALGAIAVFALYVNYLLALLVVVFHVYVVCLPQRGRWLRRWLVVDVTLALSLLPLLTGLMQQSQQLSAAYRLIPPTIVAPLMTAVFLHFGYLTAVPVLTVASLFVMLTLILWLSLPVVRQLLKRQADSRWLLLLVILLPPTIMVILSFLIQPLYYDRWFAFAAPALALFLAQGLLSRPTRFYKILMVLLIVLSTVRLAGYYIQPDPSRPPLREASAYTSTQAQPGDVVFHLHDSTFPSFRYYAPELPAYLWQDDAAGWLVPSAWKWFGERTTDLAVLFNGHARIWVISLPDSLDGSRRELEAQIEARYPKVSETRFQNVAVDLYANTVPK